MQVMLEIFGFNTNGCYLVKKDNKQTHVFDKDVDKKDNQTQQVSLDAEFARSKRGESIVKPTGRIRGKLMKFRHKVVTASSFLLLITVSLLSTQQVMTIRSQTQEHIDSSVNEILTSVGNTVQSEMNAKKDLAQIGRAHV